MKYILSPLLAPPSIPPQRGEEKDKLLILEGVGGGVLVPHNIGKCCIDFRLEKIEHCLKDKGFKNIKIEQEPILNGSDIFSVYAW